MVKENGNAEIEIARLEAERRSLVPHVPEALKDLGVDVGFHGIFCCMGAFYLHISSPLLFDSFILELLLQLN